MEKEQVEAAVDRQVEASVAGGGIEAEAAGGGIWGQCSSYHTSRDFGAVGRFISSNAMESSCL